MSKRVEPVPNVRVERYDPTPRSFVRGTFDNVELRLYHSGCPDGRFDALVIEHPTSFVDTESISFSITLDELYALWKEGDRFVSEAMS